jgi:hypothetical protein
MIHIAATKDPYRDYEGSVSPVRTIHIATTKDPYRRYEGSVSPLRMIRTAATNDSYRRYESSAKFGPSSLTSPTIVRDVGSDGRHFNKQNAVTRARLCGQYVI